MQKIIFFIVLFFQFSFYFNTYAESLEGTILDDKTQVPLEGAIIWLEGTDFIDTTRVDGYYYIANIPVGKYTVIIQHNNHLQKVYQDLLIDKTVSVKGENLNSKPINFNLSQNYPNPFNPSTKIFFQIPTSEHVTIIIYDLLGKHIKTLVDSWKAAGRYQTEWDGMDDYGNKVSSNIYFYQIKAGKYSVSKKMILSK